MQHAINIDMLFSALYQTTAAVVMAVVVSSWKLLFLSISSFPLLPQSSSVSLFAKALFRLYSTMPYTDTLIHKMENGIVDNILEEHCVISFHAKFLFDTFCINFFLAYICTLMAHTITTTIQEQEMYDLMVACASHRHYD